MRFIVMHKTNAHWEAGAIPTPELIARVGAMIGELVKAGVFLAGEGLGASSKGVRVRFAAGEATVTPGPFERGNELPAGFTIVHGRSIEDAVQWATQQAAVLGDGEVDIRPVNEPWDIGVAPRPADAATRFMVLRKATAATEAGEAPSPSQREALSRLIERTTRTGVHLISETMRPSVRGRRYKNSRNGVAVSDGPFTESKELIGGYVIVSAESLDEAGRWAQRYIATVEADEVDVRELE